MSSELSTISKEDLHYPLGFGTDFMSQSRMIISNVYDYFKELQAKGKCKPALESTVEATGADLSTHTIWSCFWACSYDLTTAPWNLMILNFL